jgi:hypothetical protein
MRVARTLHREVQDPSRGSGLYPRRSWTLLGGPVRICRGPTLSHGVQTHRWYLGGYCLPGHVAALEPSSWWGHVLFATRLKIAAWTQRLHAVVTGTPFPGY